MKIVILGAGQVGSSVAESLVSEQNDLTIVDVGRVKAELHQVRHARNIDAVNKGPLPPQAVEKIRNAFRQAETKSGKKWEGQI